MDPIRTARLRNRLNASVLYTAAGLAAWAGLNHGAVARAEEAWGSAVITAVPAFSTGATEASPIAGAGTETFLDPGADRCNDAVVIPLPVGPVGMPQLVSVVDTIADAGGTDCGGVFSDVWWEAFEIDTCATVTFEFCGSLPGARPRDRVATRCADQGTLCGPFITAEAIEDVLCPSRKESSIRIRFRGLPPGVYYLPLDAFSGLNQHLDMTIRAEACSGDCSGCLGACCNGFRRQCNDAVEPDECTGPYETFRVRSVCADLECKPPGVEFDASGVALVSRVAVADFAGQSSRANDVWGYVSPAGREYGIIGLNNSTGFVDLTDPEHPVIVADIPDDRSTWSDVKTYDQYAYNVNETNGGMQVIDLTQIDLGIVAVSNSLTENSFRRAHNLFINDQSGYLYLCGANSPTTGLIAVDLLNPVQPVMTGIWNGHYVHDVYVRSFDDCPYTARTGPCELAYAFGTNNGLFVIDVTEKTAMTTIGNLLYPHLATCHQGWMTDDERYILLGDESDEFRNDLTTTTYVIDVSDPADPTLVTTFTNGLPAIDHNLMIRGSLAFEANYTTGLRVYDISDVTAAREVAFFDTYPESNSLGFDGAWGIYAGLPSELVLISDIERGLFVLRLCAGATQTPGDYDDDSDADLTDYARLQRCFRNESTLPAREECQRVDTDCNQRVDGRDVRSFLSVRPPWLTP